MIEGCGGGGRWALEKVEAERRPEAMIGPWSDTWRLPVGSHVRATHKTMKTLPPRSFLLRGVSESEAKKPMAVVEARGGVRQVN
jgi:hypothetical protein